MNFQSMSVIAPSMVLEGPLKDQPLEVQVQYMRQIIIIQQQILQLQVDSNASIARQNTQLQLTSGEMSLAANNRIQQLGEALRQQELNGQKSLLMVENASLRSEVGQMQTIHESVEAGWKCDYK